MRKKLEADLKRLAQKIVQMDGTDDLAQMQLEARKLYENLTLLKFVEGQFGELIMPSAPEKSEVGERFEELANSVLSGNSDIPENNPHEDNLITPVMDTIKDMISEMPEEEAEESLDDILADFTTEPTFVKRDMDTVTPDMTSLSGNNVAEKIRSLNDRLNPGLHIGLNDKIAFIKHLFDGNADDYTRVISQINTMEDYSEADAFIRDMVRPDHNGWEGKEDYEVRFMQIVEKKFS
ncbi:hypothetical protein [Robertkochia solimangrovi]|uniref:hypothetical protein n=1 Tax=Robertkochia solimangrovi TaxID=2213046 RepID=UPI0011814AA1|nr:hypothetical protein [Robertkochia solimangrovi]TRZ46134.1 hypothetical protein DMZ48_02410 [Robertkochia solimangrovi]